MPAVLQTITPVGVIVVERFEDETKAEVFPREEVSLAGAVDARIQEFRTVRHCARLALAEIGIPPTAIPRGSRGAPQWPQGVVGSMTHCRGYRAAAVARTDLFASIGIDAEPRSRLPLGVLPLVSSPTEQCHLSDLAACAPDVPWDLVLFSIKESVYKAWYPLTGRWLGFEDAEVTIDRRGGKFTARILRTAHTGVRIDQLSGRWTATETLILTALTIGTQVNGGAESRKTTTAAQAPSLA